MSTSTIQRLATAFSLIADEDLSDAVLIKAVSNLIPVFKALTEFDLKAIEYAITLIERRPGVEEPTWVVVDNTANALEINARVAAALTYVPGFAASATPQSPEKTLSKLFLDGGDEEDVDASPRRPKIKNVAPAKYVLLDDNDHRPVIIDNAMAYRIKALRDIEVKGRFTIRAGSIGGYVESEANLSQEGGCWIHGDAIALGTSVVRDDAQLMQYSRVFDNVTVSGNASVTGNAHVHDSAVVTGYASVMDNAEVAGTACISGHATIGDFAKLLGNARADDHVTISGASVIAGNTKVEGNARLRDYQCNDNVTIFGDDKGAPIIEEEVTLGDDATKGELQVNLVGKYSLMKAGRLTVKSEIGEKQKLYRIQALTTFMNDASGRIVHVGDLGGYVAGYHNLSHENQCWIFDDAQVRDDARITGNAVVSKNAVISDDAVIMGFARVSDDAQVSDTAVVEGHSLVQENAHIMGDSKVTSNSRIEDRTIVRGAAVISGATLKGNTLIAGTVSITGAVILLSQTYTGNQQITTDGKRMIVSMQAKAKAPKSGAKNAKQTKT